MAVSCRSTATPARNRDTTISSPPQTAAPPPRYPHYRIISLILACAIFMEQMDATVLATALPTMAREFAVAAPAMSIALTSYLLALAVLIPASGALADRFGLRRVFCTSIGIFIVGSLLCSLANSLPTMVAARIVQGAGGAMMVPLSRLILLRTVERQHLLSAMTWTLVPAFLGPMLGPPVGGLFVTYLDWRWIFYINVPLGIAAILLVRGFIPPIPSSARPGRFDLLGFLLCGSSLGCALFGLEMFSHSGQLMLAITLLGIGLTAAAGYLWHARRHPAPLLDLSLLRIDTFRLSVISGSLMRITQGAHPFLLPLLFQLGFGYSAAQSGRLVLATALGALLMRCISPSLLRCFGYRNALIGNGILASLGYAICALFRPGWPPAVMFGLLACCGAFMSFQFVAYNTIAYEHVPPERVSSASSLYSTLQQLMLSVGVCTGALMLNTAMAVHDHGVPQLSDFSIAFLAITAISFSSLRWHRKFAADAGHEMSGHRRNEQAKPAA